MINEVAHDINDIIVCDASELNVTRRTLMWKHCEMILFSINYLISFCVSLFFLFFSICFLSRRIKFAEWWLCQQQWIVFSQLFLHNTQTRTPLFFFFYIHNKLISFKRLWNLINVPSLKFGFRSPHIDCSYITPPKYWKHWKFTGVFGLMQLYKNSSLCKCVCSNGSLALR